MARIKPQTLLLQSKKKKGPTRISVTKIVTCNLILVLVTFSLVASYKHWFLGSRNHSDDGLQKVEKMEGFKQHKGTEHQNYAILNTSKGPIIVELYRKAAPDTVDKFVELCQRGYFKGLLFHRVIKHYVIQGGDPKEVGSAEEWTFSGKSHSQLAISPKHEAFMIGTSKPKQDNTGFEIFITTAPIPDLNDKITVFGRVIKGEDVVQEIEEVDTDEHYQPKTQIEINNIELKRSI
ncbi:peptidyl-prolyl cis-trans isomerase CYP21-4 isoform X1 [Amborella trichopoda]|uniref:peptidyl-prolyl cis-trans isomerase CYP21-4 isoform X1 n=1 Tax=Amborella trichopoda TaxID=13333 RepID=UPI0005D392F8|nr:peptidyl-prolyl cis-trans isomerase CYP21-4 isoform X1 [Amborella trichopoda]XP_011623201.1 peptidyl-prolyl cis-trans isomerase CYP21-4 isoform X1 [Amborella trichopoda]XP_011623202.1 peptidyl-prolyl cis-trans isomerase CYP21-4 isoform X1 [Amborella trichopoda]XP_011623203.1 peptidyl-prolyl cis-trans isomerase CYP21-4 isoform X1 [Amborella trichopoda]XP_011623204.1 peptidyl-prolyl cis-trans isomerase CYP21-4 isoform X1 [Amborella trichopoda]XP_011623205.1 peptidyl-prolyl cis-trans isomerase|eukprot:XP_011623200.1 peptidyl-prolyl cis-trans isomerase CYP21-4 isoform X1 [Amborella trichopoda]